MSRRRGFRPTHSRSFLFNIGLARILLKSAAVKKTAAEAKGAENT